MLSLTAFAHFTRIYALCNEGCVFGGIVLIKEAIDSYYVRMVLTYDGIDNLLTYKDDHQEVEYGYEGMWKLTRRKDARGVICFLHDREERLLEIINEKGEHYAFGMDAAGILPEGEILPLMSCSPMMPSEGPEQGGHWHHLLAVERQRAPARVDIKSESQ